MPPDSNCLVIHGHLAKYPLQGPQETTNLQVAQTRRGPWFCGLCDTFCVPKNMAQRNRNTPLIGTKKDEKQPLEFNPLGTCVRVVKKDFMRVLYYAIKNLLYAQEGRFLAIIKESRFSKTQLAKECSLGFDIKNNK